MQTPKPLFNKGWHRKIYHIFFYNISQNENKCLGQNRAFFNYLRPQKKGGGVEKLPNISYVSL
jgi:hypothetical protein